MADMMTVAITRDASKRAKVVAAARGMTIQQYIDAVVREATARDAAEVAAMLQD